MSSSMQAFIKIQPKTTGAFWIIYSVNDKICIVRVTQPSTRQRFNDPAVSNEWFNMIYEDMGNCSEFNGGGQNLLHWHTD